MTPSRLTGLSVDRMIAPEGAERTQGIGINEMSSAEEKRHQGKTPFEAIR